MVLDKRLNRIVEVVKKRQNGLVVVLEDIHDPHNAEAIFRTCDAFGVQNVYLIFDKEKEYDPHKLGKKSSSSAHKWITFHTFNSTSKCLTALKNNGYFIVATTLDSNNHSLFKTKLMANKLALLVGNEHSGLSKTALSSADIKVNLPMRGMVESLNVSVATALFLYEISRQREELKESNLLSHKDQTDLIESFILLSSKGTKNLRKN